MTKRERERIKEAIRLLMAPEEQFDRAVAILCELVGWRYPAAYIDVRDVDITDVARRLAQESDGAAHPTDRREGDA